jgi:hypothetical protein
MSRSVLAGEVEYRLIVSEGALAERTHKVPPLELVLAAGEQAGRDRAGRAS